MGPRVVEVAARRAHRTGREVTRRGTSPDGAGQVCRGSVAVLGVGRRRHGLAEHRLDGRGVPTLGRPPDLLVEVDELTRQHVEHSSAQLGPVEQLAAVLRRDGSVAVELARLVVEPQGRRRGHGHDHLAAADPAPDCRGLDRPRAPTEDLGDDPVAASGVRGAARTVVLRGRRHRHAVDPHGRLGLEVQQQVGHPVPARDQPQGPVRRGSPAPGVGGGGVRPVDGASDDLPHGRRSLVGHPGQDVGHDQARQRRLAGADLLEDDARVGQSQQPGVDGLDERGQAQQLQRLVQQHIGRPLIDTARRGELADHELGATGGSADGMRARDQLGTAQPLAADLLVRLDRRGPQLLLLAGGVETHRVHATDRSRDL